MLNRARIGLTNIMPTIMIGNMEMELPTMYIMKRFIGTDFSGCKATSQERLMSKLVSDSRVASATAEATDGK